MSKIDMTKNNKQDSIIAVEKIKFYDWDNATFSHETAQQLERAKSSTERRSKHSVVYIKNTRDTHKSLIIGSVEHAKKLIKALELCIELEWLKGK